MAKRFRVWIKGICVFCGMWILFQQVLFPMLSRFYATEARYLAREKGYNQDVLRLCKKPYAGNRMIHEIWRFWVWLNLNWATQKGLDRILRATQEKPLFRLIAIPARARL